MNGRRLLSLFVGLGAVLVLEVASCDSSSSAIPRPGPAPPGYVSCVDALRLSRSRGIAVSNVHRYGSDVPGLRANARLSDLGPADVAGFCDWEACLKTNGYAHACAVAEAGIEPCRVCTDAGDTCDGNPRSRADCVSTITATGRATCHLGILEDCLIQRAIRGFGDPRRTVTCQRSDEACAGELPGDRSVEFTFAEHETSQVTVERAILELDMTRLVARPDDLYFQKWEARLAAWDGGLPADTIVDAGHLSHDAAAQ